MSETCMIDRPINVGEVYNYGMLQTPVRVEERADFPFMCNHGWLWRVTVVATGQTIHAFSDKLTQ